MIDQNFYNKQKESVSLEQLIGLLGKNFIKVIGKPSESSFTNITTLDNAGSSDLAFLHNAKYLPAVAKTSAGIVLINTDLYEQINPAQDRLFVVCKDVYTACSDVIDYFYSYKEQEFVKLSEANNIHPEAQIAKSATIYPNCFIGKVKIGENVTIYPNTVIMDGVVIGNNVTIGSNCTIACAIIGENSNIAPGCRIGSEGFGYTSSSAGHKKIKHYGRVIIKANVGIGDNTIVHKGSLRDTVIGEGTKIDSLVQIAHNVVVGDHCFIAAQTGTAGSCKIGNFVAFGGQCGVAGHIEIGSNVRFAAKSGVTKNIESNSGDYYGMPAIPKKLWQKTQIIIRRLVKDNT